MRYRIHRPAENYIYLDFGDVIDENVNRHVIGLYNSMNHSGIIEMIPSYSGLMIEFDPKAVTFAELKKYIKKIKFNDASGNGSLHEVHVIYDGDDLEHVAHTNGLTTDQVIEIHSSRDYRVYMMGFLPGFCYLGGLDAAIACPRKEKPRLEIAAGSVGIAGMQTGIYPSKSPGGWQIIGRTDFHLYKPDENEPFPVKSGDIIKFIPVRSI